MIMAAQMMCTTFRKFSKINSSIMRIRNFATEFSPEDYGYYPNPVESAAGLEREQLLARLAGDDRYEPKVYYRAEKSTKDYPNLIPSRCDNRLISCHCVEDASSLSYFWARKGTLARCGNCGSWYKLIDGDPNSLY